MGVGAMTEERTSSSGVSANDDVAQMVQSQLLLVGRMRVRMEDVARVTSRGPAEFLMITISVDGVVGQFGA